MPFDGSNFDPPRPASAKPGKGETALIIAVGALAFAFLILPVPFSSLSDIAHYVLTRH